MKEQLKKILSLMLALCFLAVPFTVPASAEEGSVTPRYNYLDTCYAEASVTANGVLKVEYGYAGFSGVTSRAEISIKIEKKTLGMFWSDVDNGEWSTTVYQTDYNGSQNFLVNEEGTYRVTVTFKIYGSGNSYETATRQDTVQYSY